MTDTIREIFRALIKKEPSPEEIETAVNIARLTHCSQNDPAYAPIVVLCAGTNALSKFPDVVDSAIEKMRKASEEEVANCQKKMAASSELLQSKIIESVVPQIGKEVAKIASAQMSEANALVERKSRHYKYAFSSVAIVCIILFAIAFGIGNRLAAGHTIQLMGASVGANAIFDAVRSNTNPWHLKKLISAGANVNTKNADGNTPLLLAAKQNADIDTITTLIESGADVNAMDRNGATPLLWSISEGANLNVITALIAAKSDVNAQCGEEGYTPLMIASVRENPNIDVINALIKAGADTTKKSRLGGKTALDYAKENKVLKDSQILKLLGDDEKSGNKKK